MQDHSENKKKRPGENRPGPRGNSDRPFRRSDDRSRREPPPNVVVGRNAVMELVKSGAPFPDARAPCAPSWRRQRRRESP